MVLGGVRSVNVLNKIGVIAAPGGGCPVLEETLLDLPLRPVNGGCTLNDLAIKFQENTANV